MQEIISKIKEKGYWSVIIRPTEYVENRIADKDGCERIIIDSKVVLRGWDYPHIDRSGIFRSGPDSIASATDWSEGGYLEYWQFFTSGQFTHFFSMREDYHIDGDRKKWIRKSFHFSKLDDTYVRFLSLLSSLFSITEIFILASNLTKRAKLNGEIEIIIELGKTKGRTLFFWGEGFRILHTAYTCKYEPIIKEAIIDSADILSDPAALALDFTIDIFKEFNWKNPSKDVFFKDQQKFLKGQR